MGMSVWLVSFSFSFVVPQSLVRWFVSFVSLFLLFLVSFVSLFFCFCFLCFLVSLFPCFLVSSILRWAGTPWERPFGGISVLD